MGRPPGQRSLRARAKPGTASGARKGRARGAPATPSAPDFTTASHPTGSAVCPVDGVSGGALPDGEQRLSAAAPFYGPFPAGGDLGDAKAAVLGVYGGLDTRVNETRAAAEAALQVAHLRHLLVTFTNADHAFFNDTGARYNVAAAAEAYRRVLDWFDHFVAKRGHHDDD